MAQEREERTDTLAKSYNIRVGGEPVELLGVDLDADLKTLRLENGQMSYDGGWKTELNRFGYREVSELFWYRFGGHYRFTANEDGSKPWFHRAHMWVEPVVTNAENPYFDIQYTCTHPDNVQLAWVERDATEITYPFPEDEVIVCFSPSEERVSVFARNEDYNGFSPCATDTASMILRPEANMYVRDTNGEVWNIRLRPPQRDEDFNVFAIGPLQYRNGVAGETPMWGGERPEVSGAVVDALHDYSRSHAVTPNDVNPLDYL